MQGIPDSSGEHVGIDSRKQELREQRQEAGKCTAGSGGRVARWPWDQGSCFTVACRGVCAVHLGLCVWVCILVWCVSQ